MMKAVRDSRVLDALLNDPSIRPTFDRSGADKLLSWKAFYDGAVAYADPGKVAALFLPLGNGVFEGHILAVEGSRGLAALKAGRAALVRLFNDYRACKVVAAVPLWLPAARYYCRRLGLVSSGRDLFFEYFETESDRWAI